MKHKSENGSVILYIFIAIGLLGALTLSLLKSDTEDKVAQRAAQMTETLYSQINQIHTAINECIVMYPDGGGDLDGDGDFDTDDNPNAPYPLTPTHANNPGGAGADDTLEYLKCPGAPAGEELIFSAAKGRFVPSPPSVFTPWYYSSQRVAGPTYYVHFFLSAPTNDKAAELAFNQLKNRFAPCEYDVDAASVPGTTYFKIFIRRNFC